MSTIYRKYRPQSFNDVTGQDHIKQTIINEIEAGKLAHAYLFSGPRGIGKTTLARLLAKSVNCQNKKEGKFEPCNECSSCAEIAAGNNIDVIEIDAASHTGVDNVRENIIENAQFNPTKGKYKVFIIDEVHMLSSSAFNALLKTLEEPPSYVIFILATTEPHKIPATIISRCQRFNFKKVSFDDMMARLKFICKQEEVKVDEEVLERVINKSDGCMRDAESLLGQILSIGAKKIGVEEAEMILPTSNAETILSFVQSIISRETALSFTLIVQLAADGVNLDQFTYDCVEVLRAMMILQNDPSAKMDTDYSEKDFKKIRSMSGEISSAHLIKMIESLMVRRLEIKSAPIPQLPLELFAVQFSGAAADETANEPLPTILPPVNPQKNPPADTAGNLPPPPPPEESKTAPHQSLTQTIKETISHIAHGQPCTVTLKDVIAKWDEISKNIGNWNHSLNFILAMSELKSVDESGVLQIAVPYSFHKDKLEENKTKKMVEKILSDALGGQLYISCIVNEGAAQKNDETELNNLAADFGGEVIS